MCRAACGMAPEAAAQQRSIYMHPRWLYLLPSQWEQLYYAQFEALDMINCLICPIFFANMLSRWPKSFLTLVYGIVLALKGYQLMLLVIPAARARRAHPAARYWIILTERLIRQWAATPLLGRGPRFVTWLHDTAAANPGAATAMKLAMMTSGITHATWSAFCLPLDICSQIVLNVVFFFINTTSALCQMAYPMAMLVCAAPQLVWCQWVLEHIAGVTFWPLLRMLEGLGILPSSSSRSSSSSSGGGFADVAQERFLAAAEHVAQPPDFAPDMETLAGRFVLATSMALLLFTVLYLPLLFAWRLELHFKARFVADVVRRGAVRAGAQGKSAGTKQGQKGATECSALHADSSCKPDHSLRTCGDKHTAFVSGKGCAQEYDAGQPAVFDSVSCKSGGSVSANCGRRSRWEVLREAVFPSSVFSTAGIKSGVDAANMPTYPVFPKGAGAANAMVRHLWAAAVVCFVLGEGVVWLCVVSPAFKGIFWPQVPLRPSLGLYI